MIRANIVIQIEDGENIYKIGDRIRIKLNSDSEYIGVINDIVQDRVYLSDENFIRCFCIDDIKAIRFTTSGETFYNTWNF